MITDTERLEFIFRASGADFRFNVNEILSDWDGDDDDAYFASAREAIDARIRWEQERLEPARQSRLAPAAPAEGEGE